MTTPLEDVLETFTKDIITELDLIENENASLEMPNDFDKSNHWKKMGSCCELVSKECTKMAVAFSKPPTPSEKDINLLTKDIGKALDMLLAWYKTFPLQEGKTLHNTLRSCIRGILTSVCNYIQTTCGKRSAVKNLVTTGTVWEYCDSFKTLPQDNTSAAKRKLETSYKLVGDAIDEVQESLDGLEEGEVNDDFCDDNEEKWTEEDRQLIKPSLGIIMACKGLLKKTKSSLSNENDNNCNTEMDLLVDHMDTISPLVDDFVILLYPPINRQELQLKAKEMCERFHNILLFIRNSSILGSAENESWITFVGKAIDHNYNKLKELLT